MGQKVNPIGIRLGITRDWSSKWYAGSKTFAGNIHTDHLVRTFLAKKLADASVSFFIRYWRTRKSVWMFEAKFFEWAYHFEDQSRVMPRRIPIGFTF